MASTVQIVPKFSFPYVETYINDYSVVDNVNYETETQDPGVHFIFPFISSKGPDNHFIKIESESDMVSVFGESNFRKYGQPYMQALHVAESPNSRVWCMRVMPDDAVAASRIVKVSYKADDVSDYEGYSDTDVTIVPKGTIGIGGTITTLPTTDVKDGDAYEAVSEVVIDETHTAEVGDIIYATVAADMDETTQEVLEEIVTWNIIKKTSTYSENIKNLCSKKFRIYYTTHDNSDTLANVSFNKDITTETAEKDDFKTVYPAIMKLKASGRGKYGNDYSVRISPNTSYNSSYGISFYNFDIRSSEKGIQTIAKYIGTPITSTKYDTPTLIDDVLEDSSTVIPVSISINEDVVTYVYDLFIDWLNEYKTALEELYADIQNNADVSDDDKTLLSIRIKQVNDNIVDVDQFDIFSGSNVIEKNTTEILDDEYTTSLIQILTELTDDIDTEDSEYNEDDYVDTSVVNDFVNLNGIYGIELKNGNDGCFDINNVNSTIYPTKKDKLNFIESKVTECYENAFNGTYDKRLLLAKRIKCDALFDACYPFSVKKVLYNLMNVRNDSLLYIDTCKFNNFTDVGVKALIKDYSEFDDYRVSKNIQYYTIKEPSTKKRVSVTISYFLARQFVDHIINNDRYVPFVKKYAQLTGHVKDSLYPVIEEYDTKLKQALCVNRFNYFETVDDNIYQRATQNTSQSKTSDLLEESNVHTLFEMKRIVEADISNTLYDFTDPTTRKSFRELELAKFSNWTNRKVQSFDIQFKMNEWEAERSILHAYIVVIFRGIQKQAILEIDINKRDVSSIADIDSTVELETIVNDD